MIILPIDFFISYSYISINVFNTIENTSFGRAFYDEDTISGNGQTRDTGIGERSNNVSNSPV